MPSGVRRKKHNRSSLPKATRRTKTKHKKLAIQTNAVISKHWDPSLTLAQNYKKLGLQAKLGAPSGGSENVTKEEYSKGTLGTVPTSKVKSGKIIHGEDGSVRVEYEDEESEQEWMGFEDTEVVKELKEMAASEVKVPRTQSDRESDWVRRMVEKHGDDYESMFWDKTLNIRQQSIGDIKRRIYKWKKSNKLV
jgi:nucleolar protein 16